MIEPKIIAEIKSFNKPSSVMEKLFGALALLFGAKNDSTASCKEIICNVNFAKNL